MNVRAKSSPAPLSPLPSENLPDPLTVSAIAIIAYALASFIHEGIGHGGTCLLTGGHPILLSSVEFQCNGGDDRLVAAAGTFANLAAGMLSWLALRFVSRATRLRYLLWLLMAGNLMAAGGYFLYSGVANIGDWAIVIGSLQPAWLWRVGLIVLGVVSYLVFVWIALREIRPFLGPNWPERLRRARRLLWIPYISGGVFICISGAFNPTGMILVAISAAAATFGGNSGFTWMGSLLRGQLFPTTSLQLPPLTRSWAWIIIAALVAIAFISILGPGVKFH